MLVRGWVSHVYGEIRRYPQRTFTGNYFVGSLVAIAWSVKQDGLWFQSDLDSLEKSGNALGPHLGWKVPNFVHIHAEKYNSSF